MRTARGVEAAPCDPEPGSAPWGLALTDLDLSWGTPEDMDLSDCAFAVMRADSPRLRDHAHRLRYRAYCVENPFENPADHPEGRERDPFDERAVHSLLIHKPTGMAVGTVRLILQDAHAPVELPIQHACADLDTLGRLCAAGHRLGEVSRFCLSREALKEARRANGSRNADGGPRAPEGLTATLTLLSAVVGMAAAEGVSHICAMMAPTLLRLFSGFGLKLRELGPLMEHHGLRQPVFSHLGDLLSGAYRVRPDAWSLITQNGKLWPLVPVAQAPLESAA